MQAGGAVRLPSSSLFALLVCVGCSSWLELAKASNLESSMSQECAWGATVSYSDIF
jgi:hypothetical protein